MTTTIRTTFAGLILAVAACGGGGTATVRDAGKRVDGGQSEGRRPAPDGSTQDVPPPPGAEELLLPHPGGEPWKATDIGTFGARAVFKLNTAPLDVQSVFVTSTATGTDKADGASFLYRPLRGDGQVMAMPRLLPVMRDVIDNRGGVMVRESLAPDAAMIFVAAGGDGAAGNIIYRKSKGAAAVTFPTKEETPSRLTAVRSGQWFRVRRAGSRFFVYAGGRGVLTNEDAPVIATLDLTLADPAAEMLYGVAASAVDPKAPFPCEFAGVQVDNLGVDPAWSLAGPVDVGTSLGAAVVSGGKLVLTSWGMPWTADPNFHRESFTFVGVTGTGDLSMAVRLDSIDGRAPDARVGLMYRQSDILAANFGRSAIGASISVSPKAGLQHHARTSGGMDIAYSARATNADIKPPVWLRLDKATVPVPQSPIGGRQTAITTYFSPPDANGRPTTWTRLAESVIGPANAAIGIFATSASSMSLTTAALGDLTIGKPVAPSPDGGAP